jgi:hypothetical protein
MFLKFEHSDLAINEVSHYGLKLLLPGDMIPSSVPIELAIVGAGTTCTRLSRT